MTDLDYATHTTYQHAPAEPKRRGRLVVIAAVLVTLVASVAYGLTQRSKVADLTETLASTRTSLSTTQGKLSDTGEALGTARDDLDVAETSLADAEATIEACADVTTAASELWDSTESMSLAVSAALNENYAAGTGYIEDASANIDAVTGLIEDNGFDTITDFLEACGDSATIT